jgi:hypothetical protein
MGNVEGGEFNVSGNEPVKQDIRDYLHGTPPAPSSPLRLQVRTQYRKQKEYEAVVAHLEQLEQGAAAVAESLAANPPEQSDVAARAEELKASLTQGEQALTRVAETAESTDSASSDQNTGEDKQKENREMFLRRIADPDRNLRDKMTELLSWVGNDFKGYGVRLPGVTRTANVSPTYRGDSTPSNTFHQFSRLDGTFERNGVRIVLDGVIVDQHGSWYQSNSVPSKITITTPDGQLVAEHQFAPVRILKQGQEAVTSDHPAMHRELLQVAQAVAQGEQPERQTDAVKRHTETLEHARDRIAEPLDLTKILANHAADARHTVPGLSIKTAERPTSIDAEYADTNGYRRIDGTVRGADGVTVVFDGVIVDHFGDWMGNTKTPSKITITTPGGALEIQCSHGQKYFIANERYYDYHRDTPEANYSAGIIFKALEAMRPA